MDVQPTTSTSPATDGSTSERDMHEQSSLPSKQRLYRINEVFYSLQGEGIRSGTANVFIRFSGCNQTCKKETHGFDCDTEFVSGRSVTLDDLHRWIELITRPVIQMGHTSSYIKENMPNWIILTGGEPGLQVDKEFCDYFHARGFKLAIETNGSIALPIVYLDWITVSPKVAEHAIKQLEANEVKYVRGYGQGIPKTVVTAEHYLISPAFSGNELDAKTLEWCIKLCMENPRWRLSVQNHKGWKVR